jgi:hypothetical protein
VGSVGRFARTVFVPVSKIRAAGFAARSTVELAAPIFGHVDKVGVR